MRSYRIWFTDPHGRPFSPEMYFRTPELAAETAKRMAYASTAMVMQTRPHPVIDDIAEAA